MWSKQKENDMQQKKNKRGIIAEAWLPGSNLDGHEI